MRLFPEKPRLSRTELQFILPYFMQASKAGSLEHYCTTGPCREPMNIYGYSSCTINGVVSLISKWKRFPSFSVVVGRMIKKNCRLERKIL